MHCWLLGRWVAALGACPERVQDRLYANHGQHRLRMGQQEGHREADTSLPSLGRVRFYFTWIFPPGGNFFCFRRTFI